MHASLNLFVLENLRNQHMALQCHKNIYFDGKASLWHFYVPIICPNIITTQGETSKEMVVPRTRANIGGKAYSVRGPKFWNSLKSTVRNIDSFTVEPALSKHKTAC